MKFHISRKSFHFAWKEGAMSSATEARLHLEEMVAGMGRLPLKAALPRLQARVGISTARLKSIWQGKARRIDSCEMDALRAASLAKEVENAKQQASRLEAMAARLEASDADFHAGDIEAARAQALRLRRLVSRGV